MIRREVESVHLLTEEETMHRTVVQSSSVTTPHQSEEKIHDLETRLKSAEDEATLLCKVLGWVITVVFGLCCVLAFVLDYYIDGHEFSFGIAKSLAIALTFSAFCTSLRLAFE